MKSFLQTEAPQFPALEIDYVPGRSPEMQFLDTHKNVLETIDIAEMNSNGIRQALLRHGITTDTPRPTFTPPDIPATTSCLAWRQTGGCDPDGPREEFADLPCGTVIELGRSGYCECKSGRKIGFPCTHRELVCEELCSGRASVADNNEQQDGPVTAEEDVPPPMDEF